MREKLINYKEIFVDYMKRTSKNKCYAIGMVILGLLSVPIIEEGTFLFVTLMMGSVLFFTNENVFEERD